MMGGGFHDSVLMMIWNASFVVQLVLLLLFSFSVVSWAVIIMKYRAINKDVRDNKLFSAIYMENASFMDINHRAKELSDAPLANVFRAAFAEMGRSAKSALGAEEMEKRGIDNIERTLNVAIETETNKIENYLILLATTASASPFIGLLGTVWGIMDTFKSIGLRGSATLAVVAPGISEALITTAIGLMAAIPASIFYNYFQNKTRAMRVEMNAFADEMLNIVARNDQKQ